MRKAGLAHQLGIAGRSNVQGEDVKKLDILANEMMINLLRASGTTAIMVSEENEQFIEVQHTANWL